MAYDQIVSEWALTAEDPDAGYASYFRDGPSPPGGTLSPCRTGPRGASCCSRGLHLARSARTGICAVIGVELPFGGSSHVTRSRSLRDAHLLWLRVARPMGCPGRALD
jgi:hypothetical protein